MLSERYDRLGNRSGDEGAYHEEKADHGTRIVLESGYRCLVAIDARVRKLRSSVGDGSPTSFISLERQGACRLGSA